MKSRDGEEKRVTEAFREPEAGAEKGQRAEKGQMAEVRQAAEKGWTSDMELGLQSGRAKRKKRLTGSFQVKVLAYFLLVISSFVTVGALGAVFLAESENFYKDKSLKELFLQEIRGQVYSAAYTVQQDLLDGEEENALYYCEGIGLDVDLFRADLLPGAKEYDAIRSMTLEEINNSGFRIWGTYDGSYDPFLTQDVELYFDQTHTYVEIAGKRRVTNQPYIFRVYIDPFVHSENYIARTYEWVLALYEMRYSLIWAALAGGLVWVFSFLFLMCGAGHRNDRQGVVPGVLTNLYLDILTVFFGGVAAGIFVFGVTLVQELDWWPILLWGTFSAFAALEVLWVTIYCSELALRLKLGHWWRNTLIYVVCRGCFRILRFLCRGVCALIRGIPAVITTLIVFLGICILELMGCIAFVEAEGVVLWALEKIVLFVLVLYVALVCKKLLDASAALAEGKQEHVVDTSRMFGDFKRHGENLNSIGQGISRAVAERMKSEHLKTELITNVSHDLKTPLTSIINYADLICEEKSENPKIEEYAEVLLRQSRRLKKLLEDLLEASKATTGNLEVNLEPCEVGVLLSQAVGEYQQKMEEKMLELIVSQPEQPVRVMADGRHLWRVFDNLLNNICKYAQEHSRVYLTVEQREGQVQIFFRNMSKYPLNISGEELEERFVRGDKSRHMEGNGLGLSIARSLVDLQNGQMQIVTDGDLFKVILSFWQIDLKPDDKGQNHMV